MSKTDFVISPSPPSIGLMLRRVWHHVSPHRKGQFGLLALLIVSASFMEIFSLGALLPFLGVLTSPDHVYQHAYAQVFVSALDIHSADEFLLPITLLFIIAVLAATGIRLFLVWANTCLTFATGADLSMDVHRRTLYQPFAVHISRNSSELISGIAHRLSTLAGCTRVVELGGGKVWRIGTYAEIIEGR
uniref:Uncharacterized protein n=1 Tax=Dechloromonas aromatica (strain RCB) TaxID=159087 RepID=Q47GN3_DECAR